MPNKRLSKREARRIRNRRLNNPGFDERLNARHAGLQSPTKFNSTTGSAAAKLKWKRYRQDKAKRLREEQQENGTTTPGNDG